MLLTFYLGAPIDEMVRLSSVNNDPNCLNYLEGSTLTYFIIYWITTNSPYVSMLWTIAVFTIMIYISMDFGKIGDWVIHMKAMYDIKRNGGDEGEYADLEEKEEEARLQKELEKKRESYEKFIDQELRDDV